MLISDVNRGHKVTKHGHRLKLRKEKSPGDETTLFMFSSALGLMMFSRAKMPGEFKSGSLRR